MAFVHNLSVIENTGKELFKINDYSSTKFSQMYLSEPLPRAVRAAKFTKIENIKLLFNACKCACMKHNKNLTLIGWYKRGEINDVMTTDDARIDSSTLKYHVTTVEWEKDQNENDEAEKYIIDVEKLI